METWAYWRITGTTKLGTAHQGGKQSPPPPKKGTMAYPNHYTTKMSSVLSHRLSSQHHWNVICEKGPMWGWRFFVGRW